MTEDKQEKNTIRPVMQKVADFGVSNANIARIVVQSMEMVGQSSLPAKTRYALIPTLIELAFRLANSESAALDLKKRSDDLFTNLKAKHDASQGTAREIPFVPGLQISFEGYFYNAKNILRDLLTGPFALLYGRNFPDAVSLCAFERSESEVSKYLRRRQADHPGYSTVRELIDQYRLDVESIVRIRNALEHPGGRSGTVKVENWRATKEGLREPTYCFSDQSDKIYNLIDTLIAFHKMLLNLCETTIVFGLMFYLNKGLAIQGIVEEKRDPKMPFAFRVVKLPPGAEKASTHFTGKPQG